MSDSNATGSLAGKVALITGAARGQGRSHALRLTREGAAIVAVDMCAPIDSAPYPGATEDDLATTALMVSELGGEIVTVVADVRDLAALGEAEAEAQRRFGGIDVVCANAGFASGAPIQLMEPAMWQEMVDINLTGVWNTLKATVPHMIDRGRGGAIILTSSANGGLKAPPNLAHYAAAKHGIVGLVRSLAQELGPYGIRVNSVHPTAVDTDMIQNDFTYRLFRPDLPNPGKADVVSLFQGFHSLPIPWVEALDVSNAVAFLACERSRYVTGICLPVDGGLSSR